MKNCLKFYSQGRLQVKIDFNFNSSVTSNLSYEQFGHILWLFLAFLNKKKLQSPSTFIVWKRAAWTFHKISNFKLHRKKRVIQVRSNIRDVFFFSSFDELFLEIFTKLPCNVKNLIEMMLYLILTKTIPSRSDLPKAHLSSLINAHP